MRTSDRSGVAVVFSVFLATFTLTPLTTDGSFLGISWLLILVIGVTTVVMRRARLGAGTVLLTQILLLAAMLFAFSATLATTGEPWYSQIATTFGQGAEHMRQQATPMEPDDGVKLIFVTGIGVIMVMTDLLVSGLRRPVLALAPPATLFLIPAFGLGTDSGLSSFGCIALGYLGILIAEGLNSTSRWTRGLSNDTAAGMGTATPVVWRAAAYIGAPALILAIVIGLIVPTLNLPGLGFGNGPGNSGSLQLSDPTLDLRRNLNQPADKTVMTYQTNQPGGVYLRMASLPQLSNAGWQNTPMKINSNDQMPAVPGLSDEPSKRRKTDIKVLDFSSEYLPLPYAPRSIDVPGEWGFDEQSLVVISTRRGQSIRNLSYSLASVDIEPDGAGLATASSGTPTDSAITSVLPNDLPDSLIDLTRDVTADASTPALKAVAIQAFLRGGNFTYSTEPQPGTGYRALENFLLRDRKGYCEQFAGAMAMMARVVGIPTRVAVGFLPGDRKGNTYEVSIRDMHAWPELYFSGYGWIRFEPTPASVTGSAPAWTVPEANNGGGDPTAVPSSGSASQEPSAADPSNATPSQLPTAGPTVTNFPWGKTLAGSGIGLLALLILAAPATIRIRRRSARLADEGLPDERVEAAWTEIRDTVVDLGGSWPEGSPRMIGSEISGRLEGEQSAALTQVATLVERSRYSHNFDDGPAVQEISEMTGRIRRGLAEPQSRLRRVLAVIAPRSFFVSLLHRKS